MTILKAGLVYHMSSVYATYIISVEKERGHHSEGQARGGHSCSCQCTPENSIGGGEGRCEERQPLVCDVSTAAKNSTGENHRGELQG